MNLVEFVPPTPHPLWKLCPQMGITDVIVKVNPDLTGLADPWKYETLLSIVSRLKSAGLNVVGLEGDPFDMSPIKEYGAGTTGVPPVGEDWDNGRPARWEDWDNGRPARWEDWDNGRPARWEDWDNGRPARWEEDSKLLSNGQDARCPSEVNGQDARCPSEVNGQDARCPSVSREVALAHYRELLESMGRLGIKLLCYNFMVGKGWSRSGVREGRGGAKATYFAKPAAVKNMTSDIGHRTSSAEVGSLKSEVLLLSHEQVWANYEHFIKAVMPTAERCGVRMGLHPDDPCLPSLGGYARIFGSVEAYDRAYALYPSPSNAVTFCQANFKLMGVDLQAAARHFGKRIAFIHVRDVEGTKEDFTELFHDQGTTDQFALMRTYREIGLDVPVRGDHVPEMAYDRDLTPEGTPGYFTLGRLFANGYLKALLQGTGGQHDSTKGQKQ